jgi:hypothetical protein
MIVFMNVKCSIFFEINGKQRHSLPPPQLFIGFVLRVLYLDTLECVSIGGSERAVLSA